jgi:hypothetical protein
MKLLVAVLGLSLACAVPTSAATGPDPQPLAIRVQAENVEAIHLPSYDPEVPIAVVVTTARERSDELSLVASGPAGRSVRAPLARDANGVFNGTLALRDAGTWRLQLASRSGSLRTLTSQVMLDVEIPPPTNAGPIGWAVGSAVFIVFGGGGFLLLRRFAPAKPRPSRADEPALSPVSPASKPIAATFPGRAPRHPVGVNSAMGYET